MLTQIRLLNQDDYILWKKIRLEMLQLHPTCFGLSCEDILFWRDDNFKNELIEKNNYIFGAFIDDKLIGTAGLKTPNFVKLEHKGRIWGMFVKFEYRGQNIASKLIQNLINYAKAKVIYLELSCKTDNLNAFKLYKKFNFEVTVVDKYSIKYNDQFYDDYIMRLYLDNDRNQI